MIRQRVRAGLKRAVEGGKQLGRPKIDAAVEKRIQSQLRAKKGMLAIARDLKVGTGTVQRVKREMEAAGPFDDQPSRGSEEGSWTGPSRLEHCLAAFLGPDLGKITKEAGRESLASTNGATVQFTRLTWFPLGRSADFSYV
jgi:hypothetical protein